MKMLDKIRQAIREERYRIRDHADEEMSDDDLESMDVEQAILSGAIARKSLATLVVRAMKLLVKPLRGDVPV